MNIQNKSIIHVKLLDWFQKNRRKLKFRETKNPYHIWVSEVMLQQTRVNTMLASYEKFIQRFPDIQTLASSNLETVLAYWKGLGYYSRAENLYKGASYILENFQGNIPTEFEKLLKVPGIGSYTASAILSIAYDVPVAVLDGNVKRVISRIFLFEEDISKPSSEKYLQNLANEFLNIEKSGDHNQALMELGALVCTPRPNCFLCPIIDYCKARLYNKEKDIPITKRSKEKLSISLHFVWVEVNGKILLTLDERRRFFKKIYTLPFWIEGENLHQSYWYKEKIFSILEVSKTPSVVLLKKHSITHHEIDILVHSGKLIENYSTSFTNYKFVPKEKLDLEFPSSISKKILHTGFFS